MAPSLKERYDQRQLQQLQERTRAADAQVLLENRAAKLLLEAMGQEDLQKVGAIVQKLDTIKSPELPHLTQAIEQAQAELNKYTGGGPITAAWTKLKSLVGIDNPVVKITTFADALERGFSQIPQILKNNGVDLGKADLSKSLATMLSTAAPTGGKNDKEMGKSPVTGKEVPDNEKTNVPAPKTGEKSDQQLGSTSFGGKSGTQGDYSVPGHESGTKPGTAPSPARRPNEPRKTGGQDSPPKPAPGVKKPSPYKAGSGGNGFSDSQNKWFDKGSNEGVEPELDEATKGPTGEQKLKNITDQIRKALAPGGLFGAFKKIPYIDGAALAQELVAAPIKVFSNVAKRIQSGAKAAEIAPDMKDQVQGQGAAQTKHANAAEPAAPAAQAQPGQPTKPGTAPTDTTGSGETPPKGPGQQRGGGAQVQSRAIQQLVKDSGAKDPESATAVINHLVKSGLLKKNDLEGYGVKKSA